MFDAILCFQFSSFVSYRRGKRVQNLDNIVSLRVGIIEFVSKKRPEQRYN